MGRENYQNILFGEKKKRKHVERCWGNSAVGKILAVNA